MEIITIKKKKDSGLSTDRGDWIPEEDSALRRVTVPLCGVEVVFLLFASQIMCVLCCAGRVIRNFKQWIIRIHET